MGIEATNLLPAVLLGIMIALTLILLPRLNDETTRRRDEPPAEDKARRPHQEQS
jgi:hypothetical protein